MRLKSERLNNLLSFIIRENEDVANLLNAVEKKIPFRLIRKIEKCKTFEYEDKDYSAMVVIDCAYKLDIKFKNDYNCNFYLIIAPTNRNIIRLTGQKTIAKVLYNNAGTEILYELALVWNEKDNTINLQTAKRIESEEVRRQYVEPEVSIKEINTSNLLI